MLNHEYRPTSVIGCPIYEQATFILREVYGREAEQIQFMDGDTL